MHGCGSGSGCVGGDCVLWVCGKVLCVNVERENSRVQESTACKDRMVSHRLDRPLLRIADFGESKEVSARCVCLA